MMRGWGLAYGHHYVGRLDDGCRLPTFLETQLLDSFISDGARNAYAAFVFDGHTAVNGAILNGNNGVVDLVANGDLRVVLLCI